MSDSLSGRVIACHECDNLHHYELIPEGAKANCQYCGNLLYRNIPDSINRSLALYCTAFFLFIIANIFPFLSLELSGRVVENILLSGGWAMYQMGMGELGVLIFLTSILFPLIVILGMLYLLIPVRFGFVAPMAGPVYRVVNAILPWSLVGVFMLGVLIAIVKLQDLANVIFGPALIALALLLVVYTAARANFDSHIFWSLVNRDHLGLPKENIEDSKILNCHACGNLSLYKKEHQRCPQCTSPLHHRKNNSIETTWALLLTAAVLLIPANVYPVMTVIRFGQGEPNTILSGVIHLIEAGMWGLAMIVFVASIVVPLLKLIILSFLLITVHNRSTWRPRDRTSLYRVTEVVGAWSMVDIFLVGLLSALVSLDALSTIRPGIGAIFFAGVVVITMFAAQCFDPRLIWDNVRDKQ
ncbi:MAG: paraquat-inducible protein A [Proteobacteria bacterium]|nr:paraquat-inducible protein A [Pseudomonadota bacterium]